MSDMNDFLNVGCEWESEDYERGYEDALEELGIYEEDPRIQKILEQLREVLMEIRNED